MIQLNYHDPRPIHVQIADGFRRLIASGALQEGDKLPSVRALAAQLSINPNTIQRAYNELESDRYIVSIPGKGSFAAGKTDENSKRRAALSKQVRLIVTELRFLGASEKELQMLLEQEGTAHD